MGYLHDGHLSLLRAARERVRRRRHEPVRQPGPVRPRRGPRRATRATRSATRELAEEAGVDLVYAPAAEEVYPDGFATAVEVDGLTEVLGGDPGAARARALPRRHHGRREAVQHGRARRRLLRPEGRPAGGRDPAHGPRPRLPGRDRGPADRPRARRPGDELAQRLPRATPSASAPRRSAGARARARGRARRGARCDAGARRGARGARSGRASSRSTSRRATPRTSTPVAELNGRPVLVAVAARVGGARLIDNVLIDPEGAEARCRGRC